MNKEVKELLNMLKKCANENKATLKLNETACRTILLYIDQLETNRDKAIEYIKENEKEYGSLEENEKIILEILKGE